MLKLIEFNFTDNLLVPEGQILCASDMTGFALKNLRIFRFQNQAGGEEDIDLKDSYLHS